MWIFAKAVLVWFSALALAGGIGMFALLMLGFASDGITNSEIFDRAFVVFIVLGAATILASFVPPIAILRGMGSTLFWRMTFLYLGLCVAWPTISVGTLMYLASRSQS